MKEVFYNELQGDEQILWSGKENINFLKRVAYFNYYL